MTEGLAAQIRELKADGLIVSFLPNIRYLTGFTGSNALLLLPADGGRPTLLTDPRYDLQSRQEAPACGISIRRGSLWTAIGPLLARKKLKRIAVESARVTLDARRALAESGAAGTRIIPAPPLVEPMRMVKSVTEIDRIRRSVTINSQAYETALSRYKHGMSERDLAAEIEYQQKLAGAEGYAFETIVASGERSALPHAHPTAARIVKDQLLLIDMGAVHEGYSSDMTRVVVPGTRSQKIRNLYRAVAEAQLAAIAAVKPGVKVSAVDRAARNVLKGYRLDKLFTHSTGHGLGLEIHEPPRVARKENTKLAAGMVITIEPGAYEKGFGGVRIEDTVLVTETGCEVLTPTSKELAAI